jgi:preprotein translocase SecE subunit
VARNRKRAKERRARRPEPVAARRGNRDDAPPDPISHATPDVELAEAQLAVGRDEVADDDEFVDAEPLADNGVPGVTGVAPRVEESEEELPDEEEEEAPRLPAQRARTGNRVVNFVQGSWRELQRVQWPDRRQVMQATGVVIGFVIIAGLYLALADTVASRLVNFILK